MTLWETFKEVLSIMFDRVTFFAIGIGLAVYCIIWGAIYLKGKNQKKGKGNGTI